MPRNRATPQHSCGISAMYFCLVATLLTATPLSNAASTTKPAQINPGQSWLDNRGVAIQAHGGGVIHVGNSYYWFGEDRSPGLDRSKKFVACYRSDDLAHWTFCNRVLQLSDPANLGPRWILERPKVFPIAKTHRFVMYMHLDNADYSAACVGVAVCDKVDGNYQFNKSFRPLGHESRDIGQFIDDDGKNYLLFEDRPFGFRIAELSEDGLSLTRQVCAIPEHLEGLALAHVGHLYYVLGSHLTGWAANPNQYATAENLAGPWSAFHDIAPPAENTYGSQSATLLKVEGSKKTALIFMADIWKPWQQSDSRYLWMPLEIKGTELTLPRPAPWEIDVRTGEVHVEPATRENIAAFHTPETFYLDAKNGSDANNGSAATRAWKTLQRASSQELLADDRLLIRAGTEYHGQLMIHATGNAEHHVLVGQYGIGKAPLIAGDGLSEQAVLISNSEYLTVENLQITNKGSQRIPRLTGLAVRLRGFGTAHDISISHLFIHDVYGSNVKAQGAGYGILFDCQGGNQPSEFDGLYISHNHLLRTDRNGICGSSAYVGRDNWHPSTHVVISNNLLQDIGGDGIVPIGTDGCVIEHNRIDGARTRCEDYAAGIWPWSADNTVVQFNEVCHMKGTHDGQGYDADWNCRNTLIQCNYSHDNEGGFLLVCDDGEVKSAWSAGNVHAVIRYNLSVNDGAAGESSRIFHLAGPIRDTQIYNNTIYIGKKVNVPMVLSDNWGGLPASVLFANNIFYAAGQSGYVDAGQEKSVRFSSNLYFGNQPAKPVDAKALYADPQFVDPPRNLAVKSTSPCRGSGRAISDRGSEDFLGHSISPGATPSLGAIQ
ncbi:MAG TPA: family 43 glycosylhydrolase [Tepidisphaeraceae bacterium]|jgi:hypothetical protein